MADHHDTIQPDGMAAELADLSGEDRALYEALLDKGYDQEDAAWTAAANAQGREGDAARRAVLNGQRRPQDSKGETRRGPSQATQLVQMALERYDFHVSTAGLPFVVPKRGPRVARALKGGRPDLEGELARAFHEQRRHAAGSGALADALKTLAGYAQDAKPVELANRVARTADGGLVLDLGTTDGRAVVVDAHGWHMAERSPVLFRRSNATLPLPEPAQGGSIEPLRSLLNVSTDQFDLVIAWLVAALIRDIAHPILVFQGEQGTAKTTAERMLARLLDPQSAQTRGLPHSQRDWVVAAAANHIIALDNVSHIERWFSDALARAVTGEGWAARSLYSNDDVHTFEFRVVLILNGIELGALRGDLAQRMLSVELENIEEGARREEEEVWAAFDREHARILGGLLDLASSVLAVLPHVKLATLPRMADFARVVAAVDRVRGTKALATYRELAADMDADVAASDPVAVAVDGFVRDGGPFEGTATELLAELNRWREDHGEAVWASKGWPTTPKGLGGAVKRLAPSLRSQGVAVKQWKKHGIQTIRLEADPAGANRGYVEPLGGRSGVGESELPTPLFSPSDLGEHQSGVGGVGETLLTTDEDRIEENAGFRGSTSAEATELPTPRTPRTPVGAVAAGQGPLPSPGAPTPDAPPPTPAAAPPTPPARGRQRERRAVCVACGHEGMRLLRSDGVAPCPRCGHAMVGDCGTWGRQASPTKPCPSALRKHGRGRMSR
jgi:predicted RNA-binding Zn-ribbon protein involved in translation (DUF1610 family)